MIRFITELFKPVRKCERVGHKPKTRTFVIRKPSETGAVLDEFEVEEIWCSRCGDTMWEELRHKGYLINREIKKRP
jgi:hypothetical protein